MTKTHLSNEFPTCKLNVRDENLVAQNLGDSKQ